MPEIQHLLTGFHVNCDQGSFAFCTVALIRGQNNILVDVGHKGRANLLHDSLVQAGVGLEDINMVVLTHAHWDHCQNIDMFPNARIVIHPNELEYAASPKRADFATARYFLASLQDRDVHQAVEGTELEPGVKILETPGHTRGHISVLVDTPQGPMAISGDALPWATSVITHQPMVVFWDPDEATESIKKLLSASRVFYPGHDRPFRLGPDDSVEYIGGADSIRLMLGQRGIGDVVLKVAPDAPTHLRFIQ
jgi:glyoxylase-like metal-dependent hydrolase (beta-lactamase superfamily II)